MIIRLVNSIIIIKQLYSPISNVVHGMDFFDVLAALDQSCFA